MNVPASVIGVMVNVWPSGSHLGIWVYPNRIPLSTLKLDQKNYHLSDMYMWEGGDEAISNGEK